MRMILSILLCAQLPLFLQGCGYRSGAGNLTAVERYECRQAEPTRHEECLRRAEENHLYHHRY